MFPSGYKHDRQIAQDLASEIVNRLKSVGLVSQSKEDELKAWLGKVVSKNPNRQQRDLPEKLIDDPKTFFHDNEHQYVQMRGSIDCPWVGPRPKVPPEPCPTDWSDPALPEEFSEGEEFPEFHEEETLKFSEEEESLLFRLQESFL